jgi:hypothetical protein
MIMIMENSKMNPLGWLEHGAVMQHRNPLLCTMGHTAFYLFYRWNIAGETSPCFRRRQQWYGLHLIKGEHAAKQMAYDTQLNWIDKMFTGPNVTSLKKTHAGPSWGGAQTRGAEGRQQGPDPPCRAMEQRRPDELLPHPPPAEIHAEHGRF